MTTPSFPADLQGRVLRMPTVIPGVAGPANFQRRFVEALAARGAEIQYGLGEAEREDVVFLIGATRHLAGLWRAGRRGARIVQRLDGMNWLHRRLATGVAHFLRAELNNLLLRVVRRQADVIVYQSEFTRRWWQRAAGPTGAETAVVHNGVPLDQFTPDGPERPPEDHYRLTVIEGNLAGGYQIGLEWAIRLKKGLQEELEEPVELTVAGAASERTRRKYEGEATWRGLLPPREIPELHRSSHLLFASDLLPACPNSVLEALACGHPVAAFATGAISELVGQDEGAVVAYGGDPWQVEDPDVPALVRAAVPVLRHQRRYRRAARRRAEVSFGVERMVAGYLEAMGWV